MAGYIVYIFILLVGLLATSSTIIYGQEYLIEQLSWSIAIHEDILCTIIEELKAIKNRTIFEYIYQGFADGTIVNYVLNNVLSSVAGFQIFVFVVSAISSFLSYSHYLSGGKFRRVRSAFEDDTLSIVENTILHIINSTDPMIVLFGLVVVAEVIILIMTLRWLYLNPHLNQQFQKILMRYWDNNLVKTILAITILYQVFLLCEIFFNAQIIHVLTIRCTELSETLDALSVSLKFKLEAAKANNLENTISCYNYSISCTQSYLSYIEKNFPIPFILPFLKGAAVYTLTTLLRLVLVAEVLWLLENLGIGPNNLHAFTINLILSLLDKNIFGVGGRAGPQFIISWADLPKERWRIIERKREETSAFEDFILSLIDITDNKDSIIVDFVELLVFVAIFL